ncbi:MAG TPA: hypothetical protein VN456_15435 [Desulfosporosinus sp.]|nr:hypothetical protein [Desulfosporosinus sp.]
MMAVRSSELLQVWGMRLSLATGLIVVLLSWINGVRTLDLVVRAGVSFGVMYLLTVGILSLFDKTAPPKPELETEQPSSDSGRGGVVDFSVGDDELPKPQEEDLKLPGQVDRDLSAGLPDSERQAEIVRRMGWDDEKK